MYVLSSRVGQARPVLRVDPLRRGRALSFKTGVAPELLRLEARSGRVEIALPEPGLLRVRGEGVDLRLSVESFTGPHHAVRRHGQRWEVVFPEADVKYMLTPLRGRLDVQTRQADGECWLVADVVDADGQAEIALEEFGCEWPVRSYDEPFAQGVQRVAGEYHDWLRRMPHTPRSLARTRERAAYLLWSSTVEPAGAIEQPALLRSKAHRPWATPWTTALGALARGAGHLEAGWTMLASAFQGQHEQGALPRRLHEGGASWSWASPPLVGWVAGRLLDMGDADRETLRSIYGPMCRSTEWWFDHRDDNHNDLPQYNSGADSGWPAASPFDVPGPIESPDLAALVAVQMHVLGRVASAIGFDKHQKVWQLRCYEMVRRMIDELGGTEGFAARRADDAAPVGAGDSLMMFVPICLGELLPGDVRSQLISGLRHSGRFFLKHGLATESPQGPAALDHRTGRGPVWSLPTLLIAHGLARSGQEGLAGEIARRFCRRCDEVGFAEQFDPFTGGPVGLPADVATAASFLVLAGDYLAQGRGTQR